VGKIDIVPKKDFSNGISLNFGVIAGKEGKSYISSLPDYFQNNPVTFSLELNIDDSEKGSTMVSTLEGVKDMILGMMPEISGFLDQGISIKFRHVGKSVFIDVSLEGMFAEMVKSQLEKFKIDPSSFSESGEFHLISGIKLNSPFDTSYEEFVKMASQFKVQGEGIMPSKLFFDSIFKSVDEQFGGMLPKKVALGMKAFRLFTSFRKIQYNCVYDSDDMCGYIKELAGKISHNTMGGGSMDDLNPEIGSQIIGSMVAQYQEMGKTQLEGIKQVANMFLDPYKEQLGFVNFDNIGMSLVVPQSGVQLKFNLCLVGITEFLRANIIN